MTTPFFAPGPGNDGQSDQVRGSHVDSDAADTDQLRADTDTDSGTGTSTSTSTSTDTDTDGDSDSGTDSDSRTDRASGTGTRADTTAPTPTATAGFFAPKADATPPASAARLRPRFGPILWGILLLAFAIYMVVFTLLPVPPDPTLWLLGGVIAVGLGLIVAGIAAAARRVD